MPARVTRAVTSALVVAYLLSLLWRRGSGFSPFWDVIVACTAFGLCAAAVWARAARPGSHRAVYAALAAGMTSYTIGNVAYGFNTWLEREPRVPSVADIGYLGFNLGVAAAIVLALREIRSPMSPEVLLDALMGALGASAGMVVLVDPILRLTTTATEHLSAEVVVATAYPVCDILLISAIIGLLSLPRPTGGPHWLWVALGLALFVLADVIYALRTLNGDYALGQPVDGLWLLGLYVIAWGAWLPAEAQRSTDLTPRRWALAAPIASLVVAVVVLVVGSIDSIPPAAVVLATAALGVVVLRTALSFRSLRQLAQVERLARTDELTGLRNRRSMVEALEVLAAGLPRDSQLIVIAIDIDDMKTINDSGGHLMGDEALRRVAAAISQSVRPGDFAARIGGDEFLVASIYQPTAEMPAAAAGHAIADRIRTLVARAEEMPLSVSVGVATGPGPRETLLDLIERADQHMYVDKRRNAPRHGTDPLTDR